MERPKGWCTKGVGVVVAGWVSPLVGELIQYLGSSWFVAVAKRETPKYDVPPKARVNVAVGEQPQKVARHWREPLKRASR